MRIFNFQFTNFQKAPARRRRERGSPLPHPPYSCPERSRRAVLHSSSRLKCEGGFTLLELIVVLGILSILAFLVTLVLDPVQMLARARDANRVTDLEALVASIEHAKTNAPAFELGGFDADGSNDNTCSGESAQTVYVSVTGIDINGTCAASPPSDLPTGWTYRCAPNDGPQDTDGTGWLPVDFTAGGGTPSISALPVDPVSTFASGFYYSYVCDRDGSYEITARMVSEDVRTGGPKDVQSNDGGNDNYVYEAGSNLLLNPTAPVGYWSFGEAISGAIANNATVGLEDMSSNSNFGTAKNANGSGMAFIQGVLGGAVSFDGTDDYVDIPINPELAFLGAENETMMLWVKHGAGASYLLGAGNKYQRRLFEAQWTIIDNIVTYYGLSVPSVSDDKWHFIVYTKNGLSISSYVDGVLAQQLNMANQGQDINGSWWFGQNCSGSCSGLFYTGELDEIRMYERSMSLAEISYIYEALKP